jgi:hypothetical protein
MNNELEALKKDYDKLLIQVQAELVQKEHYMIQLASTGLLLKMANKKIAKLSTALGLTQKAYDCIASENKKEL